MTVDLVTHRPETDEVVLVMSESRPWGERGDLLLELQTKFKTYLAFVEGGELAKKYPQMANKHIRF